MLNIFLIVFSLGFLIGVHELAHMLVAKWFGIKVLKFAFGFGPILFSCKFRETSYELRVLPLGGFVQFAGEDPAVEKVSGGFFSVSWFKRTLIALAGPAANLLLGFLLLFVLLFTFKGYPVIPGVQKSFEISSTVIVKTLEWVGGLATSQSRAADVSGPVMVTKLMVDSIREGASHFIFLLSVISLSLGLFNLFPIPGLDGGHIVLYLIEGLIGRKLPEKVYVFWSYFGFILLISLMFVIVYLDIIKLVK